MPEKIFITAVIKSPKILINKKPKNTAIKYFKLFRGNLNNNSAETGFIDD